MSRFRSRDQSRAVALWLFVCAAMVFAMVVIGGITRLTGSGLSITEWQPIMGAHGDDQPDVEDQEGDDPDRGDRPACAQTHQRLLRNR